MSAFSKYRSRKLNELRKQFMKKETLLVTCVYHAYITYVNGIFINYEKNNGIVKESLENKIASKLPMVSK